MPTTRRVCTTPGCPNPAGGGRCPTHQQRADRDRGTTAERGYTGQHNTRFRREVLARDNWCWCGAKATVADHYPRTRKQLIVAGLDPDDPQYGRGLCKPHHDQHTAATTPGGWNANQR